MLNGNQLPFELPLDQFGAPGFTLRERLDFSGHNSGLVAPHVNAEVLGPPPFEPLVVRDLTNNQLPGFNNML